MNTENPAAEFALPGQLSFTHYQDVYPCIRIENEHASALVCIYAGQVLSYKPKSQQHDMLFLSDLALLDTGKAIRGGIPICWPWFGPDPEQQGRPAHGFARNRYWSVKNTANLPDGATQVTLQLLNDEATESLWPQSFALEIQITVGKSLAIRLLTRNTGQTAFSVTQALHTYFAVGDIHKTSIEGLAGCNYIDKSRIGGDAVRLQSGAIRINAEVDRIYLDVPAELHINDDSLQRKLRITSAGNNTSVVWNPWVEIAGSMKDLADDDYLRFVCVETTNTAQDKATVAVGEEVCISAEYQVV